MNRQTRDTIGYLVQALAALLFAAILIAPTFFV
jgi:hypothetical protein